MPKSPYWTVFRKFTLTVLLAVGLATLLGVAVRPAHLDNNAYFYGSFAGVGLFAWLVGVGLLGVIERGAGR